MYKILWTHREERIDLGTSEKPKMYTSGFLEGIGEGTKYIQGTENSLSNKRVIIENAEFLPKMLS